MKKSVNLTKIALTLIIIYSGLFLTGHYQIRKSVNELVLDYDSFRIDNITLSSTEMNMTLTYMIKNPSKIPLTISVNGKIMHGNFSIAPLIIRELVLPSENSRIIEIKFSLNKTILDIIEEPQIETHYKIVGTMVVRGSYFRIINVVTDMDLSEL